MRELVQLNNTYNISHGADLKFRTQVIFPYLKWFLRCSLPDQIALYLIKSNI